MQLTFLSPSPALSRHISVFYHIHMDAMVIDDLERADVGYLRFVKSGKGSIHYASGRRDPDHRVMLMGPGTETGRYILEGPLEMFGCVLLPDFWGGIADCDATECTNRCMDGRLYLGPDAESHYHRLMTMDRFEDMARETDIWLRSKVKPIPEDQIKVIDTIGDWLRGYPIPSPEALYAKAGKSERQVLRIANRHYGAAPKMLARKYRALRTASRLIGHKGPIPPALIEEYSDKAHLSREIKQFTGLTPRQLQANSNPILRATLHPDNFRADAPWM